jgi:hypothetical protein
MCVRVCRATAGGRRCGAWLARQAGTTHAVTCWRVRGVECAPSHDASTSSQAGARRPPRLLPERARVLLPGSLCRRLGSQDISNNASALHAARHTHAHGGAPGAPTTPCAHACAHPHTHTRKHAPSTPAHRAPLSAASSSNGRTYSTSHSLPMAPPPQSFSMSAVTRLSCARVTLLYSCTSAVDTCAHGVCCGAWCAAEKGLAPGCGARGVGLLACICGRLPSAGRKCAAPPPPPPQTAHHPTAAARHDTQQRQQPHATHQHEVRGGVPEPGDGAV